MVIVERHGVGESQWLPNATRPSYGVSLRKAIVDGWEKVSKWVMFKPAYGGTISIWHDVCLGYSPLSE